MVTAIKPGWSRPTAILFASEIPVNEKAFGFALAEAAESGAELILFHAYDSADAPASAGTGKSNDFSSSQAERQRLEPLAQRAGRLGIHCKVVVRQGFAAEQILKFVREQRVDRVVIGTHTPGPVGKLLVGSVAEEVLRNSPVPVNIVGPEVIEGAYRHFSKRTILCSVGAQDSGRVVVGFAAELAARYNASLILQHVIPPQDSAQALAERTLGQIEAELPSMVPPGLQHKVNVRTRAVLGDPTEELLYQGRSQHANLIVMGAQSVSRFAAITRAGIVYKVLAYAQCPVITLSPVVLSFCGARCDQPRQSELRLAGVF
ncbi:MAG: universal stress protein [Terracidiphilus sp.]|jgi:nucleotide-binding universal stress UspA family protein